MRPGDLPGSRGTPGCDDRSQSPAGAGCAGYSGCEAASNGARGIGRTDGESTTTASDEKAHAAAPYSEDTGRETFKDSDGIYSADGELTLSMDGDAVVGPITLDFERA